ncbi:MAG: FG-GAP-like repeat-containing protein [Candidatus Zixiibacteriota bacterium]
MASRVTILSSILAFCCVILVGVSSTQAQYPAQVTDSLRFRTAGLGEPTLQDLLDSLGYHVNVATDTLSMQTFPGQSQVNYIKILGQLAGSSSTKICGFYTAGDTSTSVAVLPPGSMAGDSISFSSAGRGRIGFFFLPNISAYPFEWYTETAYNLDHLKHALVFHGASASEYIVAFEDLYQGGDFDYNDLVILVRLDDTDGDGIPTSVDNCPATANADQKDSDGDGLGDVCDNCAFASNSDQSDSDNNGIGDVCQAPLEPQKIDSADMYYIKSADLDQDNFIDLLYTGRNQSGLFVVFGKSGGGFESPEKLLDISDAALDVNFVNKDTLLDIVAHTATQTFVLLNGGGRSFVLQGTTPSSANHSVTAHDPSEAPSVATGFVDHDYNLDLVASPNQILLGNGTGGFSSTLTLPFSFSAATLARLNGDRFADLVATIGDSVILFTNNGAGTFTRSSALFIGDQPFAEVSIAGGADFNGDGNTDFALVTSTPTNTDQKSELYVCLGDGLGGLVGHHAIELAAMATNLAVSDVDRDNDLDISMVITKTRRLEVFFNDGSGNFPTFKYMALGEGDSPFNALTSNDFDRDGNPDFVSGGANGAIVLAVNQLPPAQTLADEMVVTSYNGVNITIINPHGFVISQQKTTVAGAAHWNLDIDGDNLLDDRSFDYNLEYGEYKIIIKPDTSLSNDSGSGSFTQDIRIDGAQQARSFLDYSTSGTSSELNRLSPQAVPESLVFYYTVEPVSSIQPPNGIGVKLSRPVFDWSLLAARMPAAITYQFQLDRHYDFQSPIYDISDLTSPQFQPPYQLGKDSIYYWRFRTFDGVTYSPYSRTFAAYILGSCCEISIANIDLNGSVDLRDLSILVTYLTGGTVQLPCPDGAYYKVVHPLSLVDLSQLVKYLTGESTDVPKCP